MKYLISFLLVSMVGINGWSQELMTLKNNKVVERYETALQQQLPKAWRYKLGAALEKEACNPRQLGVNYLLPNESLTKDVGFLINYFVDSVGVLECVNCNTLDYGTATLVSDTLVYTANDGVVSGLDSLKVSYCSASLDTCYFSVVYDIQVNRPGQHHFPPTVNLQPEEITQLAADPGLLTGDLFCSEFIDCELNDYEGRGQRVYFSTYDEPDPQFFYEACRIGGVDSICLRMCDVNAVCDTFHFSVSIEKGSISTPFLDDFSKDTNIADDNHWLDRDVFINRTMAVDPPSIGVATFDGIDLRGHAYGATYGRADYLTSNYIDFNGVGDYSLNYWLQPGGLGDRPEEKDSLVVEFRDSNGTWQQVNSHKGIPGNLSIDTVRPFEFYSIPISDDFEYDGFQFRFVNYSDRQGMNDTWHLDYVRLDLNPGEPFFDDVAFTKNPVYVLENYTSMPWRHFKGNEATELANSLEVGLFNQTNESLNISPTFVRVEEENTGKNIFGGDITLLNGLEANVTNQEPNNRSFNLSSFPPSNPIIGTFQSNMQDPVLDNEDQLIFNTTYSLSNNSQITGQGYEDVLRNDVVVQTTVFDNYFAYDDGTAEAAIIATEGHQVAVQYATAEPDQLQAVQFYFPHLSAQAEDNQAFYLKVWVGELDDSPEYEHEFNAYTPDLYFDTLQGFTTYPLLDETGALAPLSLPTGNFYVGWEQKDACQSFYCIGVGYDRNNPNAKSFAYVYDDGLDEWNPQPEFIYEGAIMMRPVVGNESLHSTAIEEQSITNSRLQISPNPVNNQLSVKLPKGMEEDVSFVIYNQLGQRMAGGQKIPSLIDCSNLENGFYYIEVLGNKQNQRWVEKFAVVH